MAWYDKNAIHGSRITNKRKASRMLPEVTSDWIFYGLSGLFLAYLLVIFFTKSRRTKRIDPSSNDPSAIDL